MFCTTSATEGEIDTVKHALPLPLLITDRSKVVVLLWFSVACFGVRVLVTFHLMLVHIIFISVSVAEWPPFGKELITVLTLCSLCILTICDFSYFPFCF